MNGTGGAQALGPHPPHTPEPAVASQIIHHLLSPRAAACGPAKRALRRERNWVGPHYI